MAYQLTREVLDHSPSDLGPGERFVLLAIAEFAPLATRRFTGPSELIATRAHLTPDGMRKALQRLARRGLEPRVALTVGRDGRAVYTVPGRSPTFRVPLLAPDGCDCWSCRGLSVPPTEGGTTVPPIDPEGGTTVPPSDEKGGTTGPGRRDERACKAGPQGQAPRLSRPALSVPEGSVPGDARGGTTVPPSEPPPARCPQHLHDPKPGPCGPCGDARRARERWLAEAAALRQACPWCDEGWLVDPATRDPIVKCDHRTEPARQVADAPPRSRVAS